LKVVGILFKNDALELKKKKKKDCFSTHRAAGKRVEIVDDVANYHWSVLYGCVSECVLSISLVEIDIHEIWS